VRTNVSTQVFFAYVRKENLRTYARSYARYRAYVRTLQTHDTRHTTRNRSK